MHTVEEIKAIKSEVDSILKEKSFPSKTMKDVLETMSVFAGEILQLRRVYQAARNEPIYRDQDLSRPKEYLESCAAKDSLERACKAYENFSERH